MVRRDSTLPADAGIGSNDPDALKRAERGGDDFNAADYPAIPGSGREQIPTPDDPASAQQTGKGTRSGPTPMVGYEVPAIGIAPGRSNNKIGKGF